MITTKDKSGKSGDKKNSIKSSKSPAERPEKKAPDQKEELLYPNESEVSDQGDGADTTFSERVDVTPPNRKEFPSVGPSKMDFESRPQGRTTGRMIGHEPGTESL